MFDSLGQPQRYGAVPDQISEALAVPCDMADVLDGRREHCPHHRVLLDCRLVGETTADMALYAILI